jgi:cell division protein FtsW
MPKRRPQKPNNPAPPPPAKQNIFVGGIDITILLVVVILVIIGIVMVFSASYVDAGNHPGLGNDPLWFMRRNIIHASVGFVAMIALTRVSYDFARRLAVVAYIAILAILAGMGIWGFAAGVAVRWIEIPGLGSQFQPSEVAKATTIFMLAYLVEKYPKALFSWTGLGVFTMIVAVPVGLVATGGFSAMLILAAIGFGMIFIASPHFWRFGLAALVGVAGAAAFLAYDAFFGGGFRGARVWAWLNPEAYRLDAGFQILQSLYAVASGGWFGQGIGQSRQATFLPEPHNDMIFAIIVEELGFIGAGMILILFGILIWRGIMVALKAPDAFSSMVAVGIVLSIAFQAVINVAVVTNTIPNTGVNLPFVSYGGTSLLVNMALMGVLLNISRHTTE